MSGIRAAGFSTLTSCQYVLTLPRPTNHWDRGSPPQSIVFWVNLLMIDSPARQLCVWAAVSPATHGFHISCEAIVDINIVPIEFPSINPLPRISASAPCTDGPPGIAFNRTVDSVFVTLGASGSFCCRAVGPGSCPSRTIVPNRPIVLPFDCKEANNANMWRHGNSAPALHGRSPSGDQSQGSKMQVLMRCIHSLDPCALAGARSRGYHAWWGPWDHRTCATWSWRCDIWYDMVLFPGSGHLETERLPTKKCRSFPHWTSIVTWSTHSKPQSRASSRLSDNNGVEIFNQRRWAWLRPDWSNNGIVYFLSRKHCDGATTLPECCDKWWKIILAGSRFLTPSEKDYAPIEGETLAVAWGLEQTRYLGCNDIMIITHHKSMVKILCNWTLDEINISRIFCLKQRTLSWYFEVAHLPGKTNTTTAGATSRHPS